VRVLLHTGKGGVGKTSVSLATALGAARHGHRVFVLSTDSAHNLGDVLGRPVGAQPTEVAERVTAQEVDVLTELDRSWSQIQDWLRDLMRPGTDEMVADELLVFPGMEELVALRAVREVEATGDYDVCVVDCAPTGSTLRMLRFPDVLRIFMDNFFDWKRKAARLLRPVATRIGAEAFVPGDEVFAAFERLYRDVEDVRQILMDTDRTSARLVVNPARIVVDETRRSFAYLNLYGVATDAVLVNRVLPPEAAGGYFARWAKREQLELAEIEQSFPVPQFRAPLLPNEPIGAAALGALATELFGERDPSQFFTRSRPIRMTKRGDQTVLEIELRNADSSELDISLRGDQLFVRVRDIQRRICVPDSVAGRSVASARMNDGVLEVAFEA
jgi:arsenite-transporting ATPase